MSGNIRDRPLLILQVFQKRYRATWRQIQAETKIPRATVFRLLKQMVQLGMLEKQESIPCLGCGRPTTYYYPTQWKAQMTKEGYVLKKEG